MLSHPRAYPICTFNVALTAGTSVHDEFQVASAYNDFSAAALSACFRSYVWRVRRNSTLPFGLDAVRVEVTNAEGFAFGSCASKTRIEAFLAIEKAV